MTSEGEGARPKTVEDLRAGMRVAYQGRIWQVDAVAALEVGLIPAPSTVRPQRSDGEVPRRVVSIRELVEGAEENGALWLDRASANTWNLLNWNDKVRWAARLKVINLLDTGFPTGHPAMEDAPLIPALAGTRLTGRAARRVLNQWLNGSSKEAQEIRHDLNAQHRRESGDGSRLSFEAPSDISVYRWAYAFHMHGIWAVIDGRAEPRAMKGDRAERRENSQRLVDEVLDGRTQATSQHSDAWVIRRVVELAEERGIALLRATALRDLVSKRHAAAGRTPTQAETRRQDEHRTARAVSRPLIPGSVQAWDATLGDVMVRTVPGGKPFRAHVQIAVDLASGVITSLFAVGRYRVANVLLLAFDAFRPMVLLPRSGGGVAARLKTYPSAVFIGEEIQRVLFKPGAIPARVRADNAQQNFALPMLTTMRKYGVSLSPSRVGVKTNNAHAENAIGIAANLLEDLPAYVGRSTVGRGRKSAQDGEPMLLSHLNAVLQEQILVEHNSAPCTAPAFRGTGLSRLDAWDELVNTYGSVPFVADTREYFNFLHHKTVTLGRKGLSVDRERFDDRGLRRLPRHLIDRNDRVDVIYDPRRLENIWIPDPAEGRFYVVRNVLCDYMDGPLVQSVRRAALERSGLPDTNSSHRRSTFARYAEQVLAETGQQVGVDRDLADWELSNRVYHEALSRMPAETVIDSGAIGSADAEPKSTVDLDRPLATPGMRS